MAIFLGICHSMYMSSQNFAAEAPAQQVFQIISMQL